MNKIFKFIYRLYNKIVWAFWTVVDKITDSKPAVKLGILAVIGVILMLARNLILKAFLYIVQYLAMLAVIAFILYAVFTYEDYGRTSSAEFRDLESDAFIRGDNDRAYRMGVLADKAEKYERQRKANKKAKERRKQKNKRK